MQKTPNGDTVDVIEEEGQLVVRSVDSNGDSQAIYFDAEDVSSIVFNGSPQNDNFRNSTAIPSEVYGNDFPSGGEGNDIVRGAGGRTFKVTETNHRLTEENAKTTGLLGISPLNAVVFEKEIFFPGPG